MKYNIKLCFIVNRHEMFISHLYKLTLVQIFYFSWFWFWAYVKAAILTHTKVYPPYPTIKIDKIKTSDTIFRHNKGTKHETK